MRGARPAAGAVSAAAVLMTSGCGPEIVGDVGIERGADGTLRVLVIDCAGTLSGASIWPEPIEASTFAASPTQSDTDADPDDDDWDDGDPDTVPDVWSADFDRPIRGLRVITVSGAAGVRIVGTVPGAGSDAGGSATEFTLRGGGGGDATDSLLFTAREVRALKPSTVLHSTDGETVTVTTRARFARYCDEYPPE